MAVRGMQTYSSELSSNGMAALMIPPESGREEAIRVEREAVEIVQRIPVAECERTRAAAAESALILQSSPPVLRRGYSSWARIFRVRSPALAH